MNKKYVIVAIVIGALLFIGQQVKHEYNQAVANANLLRLQLTEAIETSTEAVKSFQATSDSIRETITEIKDRLARIESSQINQVSPKVATKTEGKPSKPRIVMHSGDGCGPCNDWISKSMPSWKQQGWDVEILKELSSSRGWPWFEVYLSNGRRFEVDGPLTLESYDKALSSAK